MHLLAIDPGNIESGYAILDADRRPVLHGKVPNEELRELIAYPPVPLEDAAIEMIASYGMAVGESVFDTCVWIGRYVEAIRRDLGINPALVKRLSIKVHHCHSAKARDSNIRQALVDRFAPGATNHGKGTKANPSWFYGFHTDVWQAFALGVYALDVIEAEGGALAA